MACPMVFWVGHDLWYIYISIPCLILFNKWTDIANNVNHWELNIKNWLMQPWVFANHSRVSRWNNGVVGLEPSSLITTRMHNPSSLACLLTLKSVRLFTLGSIQTIYNILPANTGGLPNNIERWLTVCPTFIKLGWNSVCSPTLRLDMIGYCKPWKGSNLWFGLMFWPILCDFLAHKTIEISRPAIGTCFFWNRTWFARPPFVDHICHSLW